MLTRVKSKVQLSASIAPLLPALSSASLILKESQPSFRFWKFASPAIKLARKLHREVSEQTRQIIKQ